MSYRLLLFLAVVAGLGIFACMSRPSTNKSVDLASDADRASDFLALGDSYTIGESVLREDRWPVQLARLLQREGWKIDDPRIIATTGWTCADLAAALDREPPGRTYRLVTLLIGVNDQYRGGTSAAYRESFSRLLDRAVALAGGDPTRVMVLSIPDWGATPFGNADRRGAEQIGREIDAFNAVNCEESERKGVLYVDVTSISRCAATDATLVAADALHPSPAMYRRWAELALAPAREIVRR